MRSGSPEGRAAAWITGLILFLAPAPGVAGADPAPERTEPESGCYSQPPGTGADWNLGRNLKWAAKTTLSDLGYVYSAPLRLNTSSALVLGGLAAGWTLLYAYDQEIYDALKRNQDHDAYRPVRETGEFLEPMGYMGFTNQFLIGGLVLGHVIRWRPMADTCFDVLETFLVGAPGKNLGNIVVGRRGPMIGEGARSFEFNDGRSFPSGHSVAISQLARVLTHHVRSKPAQIAIYAGAGTVLLQRITSDHHWPSDVYAGALYGWFTAEAIMKRRVRDRDGWAWVPVLDPSAGSAGLVVGAWF